MTSFNILAEIFRVKTNLSQVLHYNDHYTASISTILYSVIVNYTTTLPIVPTVVGCYGAILTRDNP